MLVQRRTNMRAFRMNTTKRRARGALMLTTVALVAAMIGILTVFALRQPTAAASLGTFSDDAIPVDGWSSADVRLDGAVSDLIEQYGLTSPTIRPIVSDADRKVFALAGEQTLCLIEAINQGVTTTCSPTAEALEFGLRLARYAPDPDDPSAIVSVDVVAVAPRSATGLIGVPGESQPISVSAGTIYSVRYGPDQVAEVPELSWRTSERQTISLGLRLPDTAVLDR